MFDLKKLLKVLLVAFVLFTSMPIDYIHALDSHNHEHETEEVVEQSQDESSEENTGEVELTNLDNPKAVVNFTVNNVGYATLPEAIVAAGSSGVIVLASDYTLPAGTYTIPKGVTLLIPFDAANTLFTNVPEHDSKAGETDWVQPTAYRTLTLANGANMVVNGAISVSARHHAGASAAHPVGSMAGAPTGSAGFIHMNADSNITLNNGSKLYAWGYITGKGNVVAEAGSEVFENFIIQDFRGGTDTLHMAGQSGTSVFVLSQYYVQNIEAKLTIKAGAKETSYTTIFMAGTPFGSSVSFISNEGAMFNIKKGSVVKYYDGSKDRLVVESAGDLTVEPIVMQIAATNSINTDNFVLPIQSNITLSAKSGSFALYQDVAFLPGTEVYVGKDVTCTIGKNTNVFIYDKDQWGGYVTTWNQQLLPLYYAPSKAYIRTEADLKDASFSLAGNLNTSSGYIYTTESGASIKGVEGATVFLGAPGQKTETYQAVYTPSLTSRYENIYITPLQLQNANGSYFQTAIDTNNDGTLDKAVTTNAVIYKDGKWQCRHTYNGVVTKNATCTEEGTTLYTCSGCNQTYTEVIDSLGHTINKDTYVAEKAATCTEDGHTVGEECTVCDYKVVSEVIGALGHDYKEKIEIAPSCYKDGQAHEECTRCFDEKAPYVVKATGDHVKNPTPVIKNRVEATCYKEGSYDEVYYCTTEGCNAVVDTKKGTIEKTKHTPGEVHTINYVDSSCKDEGSYEEVVYCTVCAAQGITVEVSHEYITIDKKPHTEKVIPGYAATCKSTGLTEGKECKVCGETIVAQTVIPQKSHTEVIIPGYAATCKATGLTDGKYCFDCGDTLATQTVIPVIPHTEKILPAVEATCKSTGLTEGKVCTACGDTLVVQTVTDKVEHSWDEGTYLEGNEPTCTAKGKLTYTCEYGCGATKTETVNALGHNTKVLPAVEATCTKTGLTEGEQCTRCFTYIRRQETTPTLGGHSPLPVVKENEKEATCYEEGSYDEIVYCGRDNCDAVDHIISKVTKTVGKLEHTPSVAVKEDEVKVTCTTDGSYYSVVYCSVEECKHQISKEYVVVKSEGHKEGTAANCDDPQICTVCQTVLVPAFGHSYTATETTEATCDEKGIMTYTCGRCNDSYTEDIPAKGHDWFTITEGTEPTCTKPGSDVELLCLRCGEMDSGKLPATGHEWDEGKVVVEASCTAPGTMEYVCTKDDCDGINNKKTEEIPMLPHTEGVLKAVDPTCEDTGLEEGKECTVCHKVLVQQEVVAALGHDKKVVEGYAPTCEETGLTDGTYCNRCHEWLVAPETIKENGHTESVLEKVKPTCTTTGLSEGKECTVCHKVLVEQEVVGVLEHDWQDVRVMLKPTCTTAGTKEVECSKCFTKDYVDIPSLGGHTFEVVKGYDSTCSETGLTDGSQCTRCDEWEVEQEVIDTKPHTERVLKGKDATCEEKGLTEGKDCSVCQKVLVAQEVIKETGHTERTLAAVAPECEKTGLTAGVDCSVCQKVLVSQQEVKATGHTAVTDLAVAPECEETGLTEGSHCSVCQKVLVAQEVIKETGHTERVLKAKDATCEEKGLTEGKDCSVCNKVLVKQEVVKELGHTERVLKAVEATCEETGLTEGKDCSVCQKVLVKQEVVEELGHTERVLKGKDATCEETGLTEGKDCSVCNKVLDPQQVINAKGHKEVVDAAVDPTCEETGLTEGKHCSVCQKVLVKQEVVKELGHTERVLKAVEATCEETGLTEGKDCSVCNKVLVAQEVVKELGHTFLPGVVIKPAKCDMEGLEEIQCSVCLQKEEVVIPEMGHILETIPAKKPTYTEAGWDTYEKCTRIDCAYNTMVGIPALGEATIESFDEFVENLAILEDIADTYVKKVSPGKDPISLVIKYIRTGVERYNSGSWNIMAGYEDTDFANYVKQYESDYNKALADGEEMMKVTGMKNLEEFKLPNGNDGDLGHVIGSMDISYTNKTSQNHIDVSGFFGDSVDLLSAADQYGITSTTVEAMVKEIEDKYFLKTSDELWEIYKEEPVEGSFSDTDIQGDLDSYYLFNELMKREYENGTLAKLFSGYMTKKLTDEQRATYFIKNRLDGVTLRTELRDKVFEEYTSNAMVATLESSRDFNSDATKLNNLRRAVTNVVADWLCERAGDYIDLSGNPYISVVESNTVILAPGISQTIKKADTADGKQMDYYIATMDVNREDVDVRTNYKNNDPMDRKWQMTRVLDQANAAQNRHSNPEDTKNYIPNFNVVAAINGTGFDMATGEPSDLLMMEGIVVHDTGSDDFFGIKTDGTAVIGTRAEFNELKAKGEIREAISSFGTRLVQDGKIQITGTGDYFTDRASRTAIGITKTGKVVFLVIDGRQGVLSCGASAIEIAQIMLDAGCYQALNLDGGGSSTYVAKLPGTDALDVVSFPSDGVARSVASSLYAVSTAPSSTAFDHAVLDADHTYLTVGSTAQLTARAVSATGNAVDMPEGTVWSVSNKAFGEITQEGVFTAKKNGEVTVNLTLDGEVIGSKKMFVVVPDKVYFEKQSINAIYGIPVRLPVKAVYEGKVVAINEGDVVLSLPNAAVGTLDGFMFTADEKSGLRKTTAEAALVVDESVKATLNIALFTQDEASFDFDNATGGDYQFAFDREVSNSTTSDNSVYYAIDRNKDMVIEYTFAIDMSKIDIPAQLKDLTYMLPGSDLETASAWNYLLQLAERVSALTTVQPVLTFDKDVKVDISGITVSNEYFKLEGTDFDEEKNELTLHLRWIKQSKPIDPATANPLCILSGIKITPKANANWSSSETLNIKNVGTIGYDIYLRTNALYSFSQKPENQKTFGLYPFENLLTDPVERGGHFTSVYKEFEDEYTLSKAIKEGWVMEAGGWAYYENGAKYTGIKEVDGLYYDFGENGINVGQKPYTGDFFDNGKEYFVNEGKFYTGWRIVSMKDVRYYDEKGVREVLDRKEIPSTCIEDGECTYTRSNSEVKKIEYDDAGGHEYVKQANGDYKCSVCGHVRIEMSEVTVTLSANLFTYTGGIRQPGTTAVTKDGYVLKKVPAAYPDYASTYKNNVNVGTGTVTLTAQRYGVYVNMTEWRGNAKGSITLEYEIRPDLPTSINLVENGNNVVLSWNAVKAEYLLKDNDANTDLVYVIYTIDKDGQAVEVTTTKDLTKTLTGAEYKGAQFKIGTRATVKGKTYESINLSDGIATKLYVTTAVTEAGKPKLTWNDIPNGVSYEILRANSKNGKYAQVYTTENNSYTHTSADAGNTYYYKVRVVFKDGTKLTSDIVSCTAKAPEQPKPENPTTPTVSGVTRVFGASRYETAFKTADTLKATLGVSKFETAIVANGTNFADALAGSYLAAKKSAPILMTDKNAKNITNLVNYIKANVQPGGTVYILGGYAALPNSIDKGLAGYTVKRLAGNDRYETNLLILEEAEVTSEAILVATGTGFADSLSASATGLPMLLVNKELNPKQKAFLEAHKGNAKYIIGGTSAVSAKVEQQVSVYGKPERLAGNGRYDTSVLVAKEFFSNPTSAVVAYGRNFPDGLSGGPLAYAIGGPLLLAENNAVKTIDAYTEEVGITSGYVLGGSGLVSETAKDKIFK